MAYLVVRKDLRIQLYDEKASFVVDDEVALWREISPIARDMVEYVLRSEHKSDAESLATLLLDVRFDAFGEGSSREELPIRLTK